jgi:hypothetical protein
MSGRGRVANEVGRGALGALALALALSMAAGCATAHPLTELVLMVDLGRGLEPARDVGSIGITVSVASAVVVNTTVPTPSRAALPLTLGVTSASGRESTVQIEAIANDPAGARMFSRVVQTHFVSGQRRVVTIVLDPLCRPISCVTGQTCVAGACTSSIVDPTDLPPYTGMLPDAALPFDAGIDAHDAGLDATDAGTDTAVDVGTDAFSCYADAGVIGAPDGCVPRRPPTRPACDTGDDGMTRTLALLDPAIDQSRNRWATDSYDLDGLCTNALAGGPSECMPVLDTLGDGPGGTDDALGFSVFNNLLMFSPMYALDVQNAARQGLGVPLVRLSGWNGRADDDRVSIVVATALDVLPASAGAPPASSIVFPNTYLPPNWDGTDTAYAASNYFATGPGMVPLVSDDNAYVSNFHLVARLPERAAFDMPAHLTTGQPGVVRIRLTDARLVVDLGDGTTPGAAVLIGRWAYSDIVSYLPAVGICPGTPAADMYIAAFDILLRRSQDVRSLPGSGGTGVPCDAISVALPFDHVLPVAWGGVATVNLVQATCP